MNHTFLCLFLASILFAATSPGFAELSIEPYAGDGTVAFKGEGVAALETGIAEPLALALDSEGRVLISEGKESRVLRLEPDGAVRAIAGCGFAGFAGDGGKATEAFLAKPIGLVCDSSGTLWIADHMNHRVRKVGPDGLIETVAGNGQGMFGLGAFSGDGGPAANAGLNFPTHLDLAPDGSLLISDRMNARVRRIDAAGNIDTLFGPPKNTRLDLKNPSNFSRDATGTLLIVDTGAGRVWSASGTSDLELLIGQRPAGEFEPKYPRVFVKNPIAAVIGPDGKLYWAESGTNRVCRIGPDKRVEILMKGPIGKVKKRIAQKTPALSGPQALVQPADLQFLPDGSLLVADPGAHRVWRITGLGGE